MGIGMEGMYDGGEGGNVVMYLGHTNGVTCCCIH